MTHVVLHVCEKMSRLNPLCEAPKTRDFLNDIDGFYDKHKEYHKDVSANTHGRLWRCQHAMTILKKQERENCRDPTLNSFKIAQKSQQESLKSSFEKKIVYDACQKLYQNASENATSYRIIENGTLYNVLGASVVYLQNSHFDQSFTLSDLLPKEKNDEKSDSDVINVVDSKNDGNQYNNSNNTDNNNNANNRNVNQKDDIDIPFLKNANCNINFQNVKFDKQILNNSNFQTQFEGEKSAYGDLHNATTKHFKKVIGAFQNYITKRYISGLVTKVQQKLQTLDKMSQNSNNNGDENSNETNEMCLEKEVLKHEIKNDIAKIMSSLETVPEYHQLCQQNEIPKSVLDMSCTKPKLCKEAATYKRERKAKENNKENENKKDMDKKNAAKVHEKAKNEKKSQDWFDATIFRHINIRLYKFYIERIIAFLGYVYLFPGFDQRYGFINSRARVNLNKNRWRVLSKKLENMLIAFFNVMIAMIIFIQYGNFSFVCVDSIYLNYYRRAIREAAVDRHFDDPKWSRPITSISCGYFKELKFGSLGGCYQIDPNEICVDQPNAAMFFLAPVSKLSDLVKHVVPAKGIKNDVAMTILARALMSCLCIGAIIIYNIGIFVLFILYLNDEIKFEDGEISLDKNIVLNKNIWKQENKYILQQFQDKFDKLTKEELEKVEKSKIFVDMLMLCERPSITVDPKSTRFKTEAQDIDLEADLHIGNNLKQLIHFLQYLIDLSKDYIAKEKIQEAKYNNSKTKNYWMYNGHKIEIVLLNAHNLIKVWEHLRGLKYVSQDGNMSWDFEFSQSEIKKGLNSYEKLKQVLSPHKGCAKRYVQPEFSKI